MKFAFHCPCTCTWHQFIWFWPFRYNCLFSSYKLNKTLRSHCHSVNKSYRRLKLYAVRFMLKCFYLSPLLIVFLVVYSPICALVIISFRCRLNLNFSWWYRLGTILHQAASHIPIIGSSLTSFMSLKDHCFQGWFTLLWLIKTCLQTASVWVLATDCPYTLWMQMNSPICVIYIVMYRFMVKTD